ncbi:hypothetical protein [Olleya namhaensis]|uniref:Uncharacterized protein n=1 Tax=Olleya namhaensis TaxID=1144750 RepID=A0A1I3PMD7_9FLAO|nr:hypothetical protein [Olleya namhaensis]SFJ22510.1 hypothetical protein SAMN05443431_105177 [Olleya namhaensis]
MKPSTLIINQALDKKKCITYFNGHDFHYIKEDKNVSILNKSGTTLTIEGRNMPLELSILFRDKSSEFSLKYDATVLFDTGDLQEELEKLTSGLMQAEFN